MGDADDAFAPSKKRAAGTELNRDKLYLDEEEDTVEAEAGTFKRASQEVLATRRIVKVRRNTASAAPQSKNPFAGIRLVPPSDLAPVKEGQTTVIPSEGVEQSESTTKESETEAPADKDEKAAEKIEESETQEANVETFIEKVEEGKENGEKESENPEAATEPAEGKAEVVKEAEGVESETKEAEADKNESCEVKEAAEAQKDEETIDSTTESSSLSSFQQLSSTKNAFTGLAGTGFSSSTFSFGSIPKDGSVSLFGTKTDQPSFRFGLSGNGNSSAFGSSGAPLIPKSEGSRFPSKEEVVVETGEENEKVVFSADSTLFEFIDGNWKERGKGEVKVNVSTSGNKKARIVMRTKGNLRLVLNANLYPEMKLENMDKRAISFACVNSIGGEEIGFSKFSLKFKDGTTVESFREAVEAHKGKSTQEAVKTPENSPEPSEV